MKKTIRKISICLALILVLANFSSCAFLKNKLKNIKGELVGNSFTIDFYDNYGTDLLTIHGNKVGLEANYVSTDSIDSDGSTTTNYELSSVVTLTVDGSQIAQTGNTIISLKMVLPNLKILLFSQLKFLLVVVLLIYLIEKSTNYKI